MIILIIASSPDPRLPAPQALPLSATLLPLSLKCNLHCSTAHWKLHIAHCTTAQMHKCTLHAAHRTNAQHHNPETPPYTVLLHLFISLLLHQFCEMCGASHWIINCIVFWVFHSTEKLCAPVHCMHPKLQCTCWQVDKPQGSLSLFDKSHKSASSLWVHS